MLGPHPGDMGLPLLLPASPQQFWVYPATKEVPPVKDLVCLRLKPIK